MKLLSTILPLFLVAAKFALASPVALASTAPTPQPTTYTDEQIAAIYDDSHAPADGSKEAWAVLEEVRSKLTSADPARMLFKKGLEKRDSYNCNGSFYCFRVEKQWCRDAVGWYVNDNQWYQWYVSRCHIDCTAIYTCENGDYGGGWPGWFLKEKWRSIHDNGGCGRCGTCWFWGTCRVTFNYASSCQTSG